MSIFRDGLKAVCFEAEAEAEAESSRPRQGRLKTRQDQGSYWIWSSSQISQSASIIKFKLVTGDTIQFFHDKYLNLNLSWTSVHGWLLKVWPSKWVNSEACRVIPSWGKALLSRPSRGRGRIVEAEARPRQQKICLEAASSWGICLEDYISVNISLHDPFLTSKTSKGEISKQ